MISRSDLCSFSSCYQPHLPPPPRPLPSGHWKISWTLPQAIPRAVSFAFFSPLESKPPHLLLTLEGLLTPSSRTEGPTSCSPRDGPPLSSTCHICFYVGVTILHKVGNCSRTVINDVLYFLCRTLSHLQGLSPPLHPGAGQSLHRVKEVPRSVLYKCRSTNPEPTCPPPTSTVRFSCPGPLAPALIAQGQVPDNSGQPYATES